MKVRKIPELDATDVNLVFAKYRYRLPRNCEPRLYIARWHFGKYYGYGTRDTWIPLDSVGGMATKAWHDKTVSFPWRIEKSLRKLLKETR